MKKNSQIFREVNVYQLSHSKKSCTSFHLLRAQGDFLDQLGFSRKGPISIYQEGKMVILKETADEKK